MKLAAAVLVLVASAVAALAAQVDPQALQRMVATERAFAAATAEIGVRDGFLTFFAPDSVSLDAGASGSVVTTSAAKSRLAASPLAKLPILSRLMWEPFTGQISEDGSLGWLTGPYVNLAQTTKDITAKGAYFSVWKRQPDGTYRVWLDEGISLPDVWSNASEFRAAPAADPGSGPASSESIDEAERAVASGGDEWTARLAATARLHRDGVMPISGRDAAVGWARTAWTSVKYVVVRTERSGSGDLAVTLGGYDATTAAGPQHGTWVRVWQRAVTGHWRIVFETSK